MVYLLNAFIGFLLGAFAGRLVGITAHCLPSILLDEESEREPRDLPEEMFKKPRCRCCDNELSLLESAPLYSFIANKGTCPHCKKTMEVRMFALEAACALLFGGALLFFPLSFTLFYVLFLCCLMICCFLTDYDYGILPDQLTLTLVWAGLLASLVPVFTTPEEAIIGAAGGYGIFWVFNEAYRLFRGFDGMFPGDFKLNAGIGACVGIKWLMVVILVSFALLIVGAVVQMLSVKKSEQAGILYKEFPYGCYASIVASLLFLFILNEPI